MAEPGWCGKRMNAEIKARLLEAWSLRPAGMRSPPATEPELLAFEAEHGPIPADVRWFLAQCGGGVVGSEWVDGVHALTVTHRKFRREWGPPRGWTLQGVFVLGWDGSGNPFGVQAASGAVVVEDHNFGGIHELASSVEAFLFDGILK